MPAGAGILAYCVKDQQVLLLFHETSRGKKLGFLMDSGGTMSRPFLPSLCDRTHPGACNEGESLEDTAAREFAEETLGAFCTQVRPLLSFFSLLSLIYTIQAQLRSSIRKRTADGGRGRRE